MVYEVSTPTYSGPFDLLLQLILREEVEIYDIAIAPLTDAFLAEIDRMPECDLEVATEFLLIAATLVDMKVKRMLPTDTIVELDDELSGISERDLLLARLSECAMFRHASERLRRISEVAALSRPRRAGATEERWLMLVPSVLDSVSPEDVTAAYLRAMAPAPSPRVDTTHITPISVTVGDAVAELVEELTRAKRATFRRLTSAVDDRIGLVVRFLALLELVKQGLVDVEQASTFGDIVVVWTGGDDAEVRQVAITGADSYEG